MKLAYMKNKYDISLLKTFNLGGLFSSTVLWYQSRHQSHEKLLDLWNKLSFSFSENELGSFLRKVGLK